MKRIALVLLSLSAGAFAIGSGHAFAQVYPTRPVRLVVPFAPGGAIDLMGRYYGQKLADIWKQQVIVDNRAGAGSNIGANVVAIAAPDAYTLLINSAAQAISPALYRKQPFDPVKDFSPVSQLSSNWLMLVGNPKLPASSVKELIALARSSPGKLNYGSAGMGSSAHLAGELFKSLAGIDIVHVPYKGDAAMMPSLLADDVQFSFLPIAIALTQIKSGKLRALAVTGTRRVAAVPEVPTVMETGLPEYEFSGWVGIFAPGGTPRDIVAQINADLARVLGTPEVQERVRAWGYEPVGSTPEEFAAKYRADIGVYRKIIRDAKVPLID